VTAAYHLGPLNEAETRAYIEHRLRRAEWKGDPHFTEASFPVIYQHTEGVPRRINTLCSRLLLYGFLEQLHTLTASAVDKVANDLREEIAVVASPPALPAVDAATGALGAAFPAFVERLAALEKNVDQHDRLIRRAIEIAAHYFQGERP
jgi:general secretion pathway protein A